MAYIYIYIYIYIWQVTIVFASSRRDCSNSTPKVGLFSSNGPFLTKSEEPVVGNGSIDRGVCLFR